MGTAMIGIYLTQGIIRRVLANKKDRLILVCTAAFGLLIFGGRYRAATQHVPIAANNIYEQQLQMHYFVNNFYSGPVAVNDLGLVSYHNPNFVLDLVGLASEEARALNASGASAAAYQTFVSNNRIHLVIVYDEFFRGKIPAAWKKVASMYLSRTAISAAFSEVQFYATDDETAAKVREELHGFQETLPPRVVLTIY